MEFQKEIATLQDSLAILAQIENKAARRIRDHEERLLDREKLAAQHTQWLLDHEQALTAFRNDMADLKDRLNVLTAFRGRRQ